MIYLLVGLALRPHSGWELITSIVDCYSIITACYFVITAPLFHLLLHGFKHIATSLCSHYYLSLHSNEYLLPVSRLLLRSNGSITTCYYHSNGIVTAHYSDPQQVVMDFPAGLKPGTPWRASFPGHVKSVYIPREVWSQERHDPWGCVWPKLLCACVG